MPTAAVPSWLTLETANRPVAIAHRGASALAPENTPAAFEAAIAARAFAIETDIRMTRDGHLVCHHDPDLRRLAGIYLRVEDLSLADLRRWGPSEILTLDEAIDAVAGRAALLLDLKQRDPAFHRALTDALRARGQRSDIALGVRSLDQFDNLTMALPWLPTVGLLSSFDDLLAFVADGGTVARLWERDITADRIDELRGFRGLICAMAGTPGDTLPGAITPDRLARLVDFALDAIMLNDPRLVGAGVCV